MSRGIASEVEIVPLIDAVPEAVPLTWPYPGVTEDNWRELHCDGLDEQGRFRPSLGCFLLRSGSKVILVDAGIGPGPNAYLGGLRGHLPHRLEAEGVMPSDVDLVIFTHLHMDHVGWAGGATGRTFPRARYVAPAPDAEFFGGGAAGTGPQHLEAYGACIAPLIAAGQIDLLPNDAEIEPGIRYFATPGHTPGHQSVLFETSEGVTAVVADVVHSPAQIERPDWAHRADHDPDKARETRKSFIERAASGGWRLAAGHFRKGLQIGRIEPAAEGYRFRPEGADT